MLYSVIINQSSLKNEEKLKKLYIEENDERTIMINRMTGAIGITICTLGLAMATLIAGYFNQMIFLSLLGATAFTASVKGFLKIYYRFKF